MRKRIGCAGLVVLVLIAVGCTGNDDERTRESCSDVGASCGTVAPLPTTTTVAPTTAPQTTAPQTTAPPTTVLPEPITRPIIDPTKCRALAARQSAGANLDLKLFARPNQGPSTIQVIASPSRGPAGVQSGGATSKCQVPSTGSVYRVDALSGDPVFQYAMVIDRPIPLEVGLGNGTVITIAGPDDPTAPTVDDVVNADPEQWDVLLRNDFLLTG